MIASYILVCSPMRTGSTLVYNFFNECTSGYSVKKYEISPMDFIEGTDFAPILFRHPVASIASLLEFLNKDYTLDNISSCYDRLKQEFQWAKQLLTKFPNCTKELRYENFYNNIEYLADWTRINLNYQVTDDNLTNFKLKFNIGNVKTMSENNLNLFQPNHISVNQGSNKEKLEKMYKTKLLYKELSNLANDYGYDF